MPLMLLLLVHVNCLQQPPGQVHLSLTGVESEMMVTWSGHSSDVASEARVSSDATNWRSFNATQTMFDDQGTATPQYFYRAMLTGLTSGTRYQYVVGSLDQWSDTLSFTSQRASNSTDKPWKFLVLADLGLDQGYTLPNITSEVLAAEGGQEYSALFHAGDLAYDLHDPQVGDQFMQSIQAVASTIPYHVCPGNHESHHNFSQYRARFSMPQSREFESLWHSVNIGPVHFVSYSTESYFDESAKALNTTLERQYEWLVADLAQANSERDKRPWVIVQGHRPFYCSDSRNSSVGCDQEAEIARHGTPTPSAGDVFAVEPLFHKYGVDLAIFGHVHDYTRYWPVYNLTVMNGTGAAGPYHNPRATVHMTVGAAGNDEMHYHEGCVSGTGCTVPPPSSWAGSAAPWAACNAGDSPHCVDYSYGRFVVHNASHLYWSQFSVTEARVIDEMWIIQERHGTFNVSR